MILITGANGHLGSLTIDFLVKNNSSVAVSALVRSEEKGAKLKEQGIALRIGDYADPASLKTAMEGVDVLLLISSGSLENRTQQHANVIDAAKTAGIKHLVYTSVVKPAPDSKFVPGIDHYHTEALILASGIPYTILRNTFYFEVLPMFLADSLTSRQWYYPSAGATINLASRVDMAEALARVLAHPADHLNQIYDITSSSGYTFEQIAEVIAAESGLPFTYTDIPQESFLTALSTSGMDPLHLPIVASIAEAIQAGELDINSPDLKTLLGRAPMTLDTFLEPLIK